MAKKTLYVFRAENGIWRNELSNKIGVDEQTLKQIEDAPEVPQEIAEKVVAAYSLPEDYFTVDPNAKDKRYKPKKPFKYFLKVSLAWEFLIALIFAYLVKPEYAYMAILGPLYIGIISMIPMIIMVVIICAKEKI